MNEKVKFDPLRIVGTKVLEDWAMMIVDEISPLEAEYNKNEPLFMAWVDVHGVIDGALSMVAQRSFLNVLTHNVLGVDESEELPEKDLHDAFCEMSNIIAGNFFTEAYGKDVVFEIIKPHISVVDFSVLDEIRSRKVKHFFIADGQPVAMTFKIIHDKSHSND